MLIVAYPSFIQFEKLQYELFPLVGKYKKKTKKNKQLNGEKIILLHNLSE